MALPVMQKKNLDQPDEIAHYGRITKENVVLDGVEVDHFAPGAKWSHDLKPHAGTDSCELPHVAYVASGQLHVVMDDGAQEVFGTGDVMMLPPGHKRASGASRRIRLGRRVDLDSD